MIDMTKGNSMKLILAFVMPMILGNIFQQIYNLVDTVVVGKFVGTNALAAVGSSFSIMVFITSIIIGLCMGSGVILSQFYGSKDMDKFKKVTITSFVFIMLITVVLIVISLVFIDEILILFNMPIELIKEAKTYLVIIIGGLFFTFLYNIATSLLRAVGDSKRPLYFLIVASIINVILDLIFVLVFNLGVMGVALATVIAQAISAILSITYAYKNLSFFKLSKEDFEIDKEILKITSKYSLLTAVQQSIMNFGILIVQGIVNTFGLTVMAAFAAGVKIDSLAYMPVQDFGNAFSTFVAQNKGAGKLDRVKDGVKAAAKTIIIFSTITSTLIFIFAEKLMTLFVNKSEVEVIALGVEYIQVVAVFYVLIGFLFMFYGLYRGLGNLNMSIILTIVSLGSRVILAYVLSKTALGASGIWWSIPIGWALADILGIVVYMKKYCSRQ